MIDALPRTEDAVYKSIDVALQKGLKAVGFTTALMINQDGDAGLAFVMYGEDGNALGVCIMSVEMLDGAVDSLLAERHKVNYSQSVEGAVLPLPKNREKLN